MNTQQALELPASPPSNTVVINARCTLRTQEAANNFAAAGGIDAGIALVEAKRAFDRHP